MNAPVRLLQVKPRRPQRRYLRALLALAMLAAGALIAWGQQ